MRIVVTGATGFVGRAFVRRAVAGGHTVSALVRQGSAGLPADPGVTPTMGTLAAPPWDELVRAAPDVCVHTAWITDAGVYRDSPENRRYMEESLVLVRGLLERGVGHVVALGTSAEYRASSHSFWDLFYEHCNYFPRSTLAWLCGQAGFDVVAHDHGFDAQYQVLWLRRATRLSAPDAPPCAVVDLAAAAATMDSRRLGLERELAAGDPRRGWAIWGAGAKGVTLAHRLTLPPRCLIDTNPAKQGGYIPGLAVPIVAPDAPVVLEVGAVVIVNPNYAGEIRADLETRGFNGRIVTL